jgi:hypothetical protein
MSGVVLWDNSDRTILHLRFKDVVTINDYARVVEQANALLKGVRHRVHVLIDARDAWIDNSASDCPLPHLLRGEAATRGSLVMVNGDKGFKALFLHTALPEAPQFVGTLAEAYALMQ